jgi:hypothetical protein
MYRLFQKHINQTAFLYEVKDVLHFKNLALCQSSDEDLIFYGYKTSFAEEKEYSM